MNAMETWIRDFRHSARSLARTPGFTLTVVATLALAIGANAAIFSVVKAVLLEPFPFPNATQLVHIGGTAPGTDQPEEFGVPESRTSPTARVFPGSKTPRVMASGRRRHARKGRSTNSS